MAYFTPIQSGPHSFFLRADDESRLYLKDGHNMTDITSHE